MCQTLTNIRLPNVNNKMGYFCENGIVREICFVAVVVLNTKFLKIFILVSAGIYKGGI